MVIDIVDLLIYALKNVIAHRYVKVYVVDLSNVFLLCGFHEMWFQSNVPIFG
jgi:hypothetical protein